MIGKGFALALGSTLVLTACGGNSPADVFVDICEGTKTECMCIADSLNKKISKADFEALNTLLTSSDKDVGELFMTEGLVNQQVTEAFLTSAKACSEK